ncbi:MAG: tape measure protein, partial [Desulfuromonadaceae bacterium]|nr:tape measure protein [Desulfuromonadaceae bacterium]
MAALAELKLVLNVDGQGRVTGALKDIGNTARTATERMSQGMNAAGTATRQAAAETDRLASCMNMLKTALSALIGVQIYQYFKNSATSVLQAGLTLEKVTNQLKAMTGSSILAASELKFIRDEANRLGLDMATASGSFSKFLGATKNTEVQGTQSRKVFIGISEGLSAMKLNAEETGRAFIQLTQMLSKGKLQSEDLMVLSESLPGAKTMIAQAMGMNVQQLSEGMKAGTIDSIDALKALSAAMHETYGQAAVESAQSAQGAINRFNNALVLVKEEMSSKVLPVFAATLNGIMNHTDELKTAFIGLGIVITGLASGMVAQAITTWVGTMQVQFALMKMEMAATGTAAGVLSGALTTLKAVWAANPIGLIVTALTTAAGAWYLYADNKARALEKTLKEYDDPAVKKIKEENAAIRERIKLAEGGKTLSKASSDLAIAQKELAALSKTRDSFLANKAGGEVLSALNKQLSSTIDKVEYLKQQAELLKKEEEINAKFKGPEGPKDDEALKKAAEYAAYIKKVFNSAYDTAVEDIEKESFTKKINNALLFKLPAPELKTPVTTAPKLSLDIDLQLKSLEQVEQSEKDRLELLQRQRKEYEYQQSIIKYIADLNAVNSATEASMVGMNSVGEFNSIADQTANAMAIQEEAHKSRLNMIEIERDANLLKEQSAAQLIESNAALDKKAELEKRKNTIATAAISDKAYKSQLSMAAQYTGMAGQFFSTLADTQDQSSRKGFESAKAFNLAAAVMSTAAAIMNAMATAPFPLSIAQSALAAATGAIQIAKIASTSFGGGSGGVSAPSGSIAGSGGVISSGGALANVAIPLISLQDQADSPFTKAIENNSEVISRLSQGIEGLNATFQAGGAGNRLAVNAPGRFVNLNDPSRIPSSATKGGIAAGFVSGAATGTALLPGIGTAIGAVTGAIEGYLASTVFGRSLGIGSQWRPMGAGMLVNMSGGTANVQDYMLSEKDGGAFKRNKISFTAQNNKGASEYLSALILPFISELNVMAETMGTTLDPKKFRTYTVGISTVGKTSEQIGKELSALMASTLSGMTLTIDGMDELLGGYDDAYERFIEINNAFVSVNAALTLVGDTAIKGSVATFKMADGLVTLMGGLDAFNEKQDAYRQAMYTDSERGKQDADKAEKTVNDAWKAIGGSVPETIEQFNSLRNSLDLTTASGAETYAALTELGPQFAIYTKYNDELIATVNELITTNTDLMKSLLSSYGSSAEVIALQRQMELEGLDDTTKAIQLYIWAKQDEIAVQQQAIESSKQAALATIGTTKSLLELKRSLLTGTSAGLSPEAAYTQARQQFESSDATTISANATAFIEASKNYNASNQQFQSDFASVISKIDSLSGTAGTLSDTEKQIALLEKIAVAVGESDGALIKQLSLTWDALQIDTGAATSSMSSAYSALATLLSTPLTLDATNAASTSQAQIDQLKAVLNTGVTGTAAAAINLAISAMDAAVNKKISTDTAKLTIESTYSIVQASLNKTIDGTIATNAINLQKQIIQANINGSISAATAATAIDAQQAIIQANLNGTISAATAATAIDAQQAIIQANINGSISAATAATAIDAQQAIIQANINGSIDSTVANAAINLQKTAIQANIN